MDIVTLFLNRFFIVSCVWSAAGRIARPGLSGSRGTVGAISVSPSAIGDTFRCCRQRSEREMLDATADRLRYYRHSLR